MSRRKIKSDLSAMTGSCRYLVARNSSFLMQYTSLRKETLVSFVSKITTYKVQLQTFKSRLKTLSMECHTELHIFFRQFNRKCVSMMKEVNNLISTCTMLQIKAAQLIAEFQKDYVFKLGEHILKSLVSLLRFNVKLSFYKRKAGKFTKFNVSLTRFMIDCNEYNNKLYVVPR